MRWIYEYVGEQKKGVTCTDLYTQWIPKGLEYQEVLNLARVAELVPNELQTAFPIPPPLIKLSGGPALENADRVNTTALPAKSFSTT